MFQIKRITDPRLSGRVCQSFGVFERGAFAYGAFQNDNVLATAVFLTSGGCVTLLAADAGRKPDIGLIDGMARAAFSAQLKAGAKTARLGEGVPADVRLALSKLHYAPEEAFDLEEFFSKKCCGK